MIAVDLLREKAIVRGRSGSLGAALRGWRIDSATLMADPAASMVIHALLELMLPLQPNQIIGIEHSGAPLASHISSASPSSSPLPAIRYSPHSNSRWPDGPPKGRAVLIDDVINTGRTAARAIRRAEKFDVTIVAVVCLVQYRKHRPAHLRRWAGPIMSLAHLTELALPFPIHLPRTGMITSYRRR